MPSRAAPGRAVVSLAPQRRRRSGAASAGQEAGAACESPCPVALQKQHDISVFVPQGWPSQDSFYYKRVKPVISTYYVQEVYALLGFGAKAYGSASWLNT